MTCVWILIALVLIVIGTVVVASKLARPDVVVTGEQVASQIEAFLENREAEYTWDEFLALRLADPTLDAIRVKCAVSHAQYPPGEGQVWCNAEGKRVLRDLAAEARKYGREHR